MEYNFDNPYLHQSSGDDTPVTTSAPSAASNSVAISIPNGGLLINQKSTKDKSSRLKSESPVPSKYAASGSRSAATKARLSVIGLAVSEPIKKSNAISSGESIEYLEESFDSSGRLVKDSRKTEDKGNRNGEEEVPQGKFWFSKFSRKQLLTLISLCMVDFTSSMGMSIMAPFFPVEAANKGMDEATSGFVFSTYALVMFATSPIFGRILPIVGSQFLFFGGLFLAAGCTVLFGWLDQMDDSTFTIFCFVVRSFEALGAAAFNTAACTLVAQVFPDNVSAVFGLLETFVGLGMTMGPAVGGFLYALRGFGLPFFILGGFMVVMIPVNIWLLPREKSSNIPLKAAGSFWKLIRLPRTKWQIP